MDSATFAFIRDRLRADPLTEDQQVKLKTVMGNNAYEPTQLMTLRAAARRLSLHPGTLRRWIKEGKIAGVKISPKDWRVSITEIQRIGA